MCCRCWAAVARSSPPTCPATARAAPRPATILQPAWPALSPGSWMPSDWTGRPWPATPWVGWPPCSWRCRNPNGSPPCAWSTALAGTSGQPGAGGTAPPGAGRAGDRLRPASAGSRPAGGCPGGAAVRASMAGAPILAGRAVPSRSPTRILGGDGGQLVRRARNLRPAAGAGQAAVRAHRADTDRLGDGRLGHSPLPRAASGPAAGPRPPGPAVAVRACPSGGVPPRLC
jgi:hypothetical protein